MSLSGLTINIWNVEHGVAIYAKTPNGRHVLLDAGASQTFSPAKWLHQIYDINSVDQFILSHADTDHITDIENVDNLLHPQVFLRNKTAPKYLIYPTYPPLINPLKYYHSFDQRYSMPLEANSPHQFDPISNWGGVTFRTFRNAGENHNFTKLNDYSLVTVMLYENLQFLFPGDLEEPGWEALMKDESFINISTPSRVNKSEIRILVAAHHGREAGVYHPFLKLYQPHLTIICDHYGSPYTAYDTYRGYSQGHTVYHNSTKESQSRFVLSTKVNDYVLINAAMNIVTVVI